ncbi:MAG: SDR family oxidoreductase, partial [Synergistes sp.]|nr:SDR family oxidoreductase [Synergistes sp.]
PKTGGSIVNVASVSGVVLRRGNSAYGVSKTAMIAWTEVLSVELMGRVRVNAVAPGFTDTDMGKLDIRFSTIQSGSVTRIGKTSEIACAIYFLSSDEASFINGHTLVIDGGIESKGGLYGERL